MKLRKLVDRTPIKHKILLNIGLTDRRLLIPPKKKHAFELDTGFDGEVLATRALLTNLDLHSQLARQTEKSLILANGQSVPIAIVNTLSAWVWFGGAHPEVHSPRRVALKVGIYLFRSNQDDARLEVPVVGRAFLQTLRAVAELNYSDSAYLSISVPD